VERQSNGEAHDAIRGIVLMFSVGNILKSNNSAIWIPEYRGQLSIIKEINGIHMTLTWFHDNNTADYDIVSNSDLFNVYSIKPSLLLKLIFNV
jgi:hypothetical protein